MHSKSNNIEFTSYNDINEIIQEPFKIPRSRFQRNFETSWKKVVLFTNQFNWYITSLILNVEVHIMILQAPLKKEKSNNKSEKYG